MLSVGVDKDIFVTVPRRRRHAPSTRALGWRALGRTRRRRVPRTVPHTMQPSRVTQAQSGGALSAARVGATAIVQLGRAGVFGSALPLQISDRMPIVHALPWHLGSEHSRPGSPNGVVSRSPESFDASECGSRIARVRGATERFHAGPSRRSTLLRGLKRRRDSRRLAGLWRSRTS